MTGTIAGFLAFEEGAYDLIVSDIGLPLDTGLDLIRRVVAPGVRSPPSP
jgi:CheY-like chemotaxis protein